jgi:hypothetical protein
MNPQLLGQLASQRDAEIRLDVASCHRQATASRQILRRTVREQAGRALIHAGLKLAAPPAQRKAPRPYPAGL